MCWQDRTQNGTKLVANCFARLLSYINHTKHHIQYRYVGDGIEGCKLALSLDASFAKYLQDSKSTSAGLLSEVGPKHSSLISWMCMKQTAVSHSSAESELMSLDAGSSTEGNLLCLGNIFTFYRYGTPSVNVASVIHIFILTIKCHLI